MKVPPDYYKGLQATSKGHTPLLIPVVPIGKCKQANEFQLCHFGDWLLIIHEQNWRWNSNLHVATASWYKSQMGLVSGGKLALCALL